jgi:hypothetical protein
MRSTWLASDCNRCWCEASYHLLTTDTRQQCLTLGYKPWYHCGANAEMVVVTALMSDMYHLLHICHVLIEVTITFSLMFVTLFFESSLYIHCSLSRWVHKHWMFWMVGFLCHLLIIFTMCSSSDFHPAMPTQYCNLPYISIIYWMLCMSSFKMFSYIVQVFVCSVWWCTISNFFFIMPMI